MTEICGGKGIKHYNKGFQTNVKGIYEQESFKVTRSKQKNERVKIKHTYGKGTM